MEKNKILIRINNINEIKEYKKVGISNFLFALKDFSIGYNTYNLEELKQLDCNTYLLINRVFDNNDINKFIKIIDNLSFVKGIIFEDISVYMLLKETNIPLIWNQSHAAVSSKAVNAWLELVSSSVVSLDLELSEIQNIINTSTKNLILPILGYNPAMYSRRELITSYNKYKGLNELKRANLIANENTMFIAKENQYGTILFYQKPYNLINVLDKLNSNKISLYLINCLDEKANEIIDILNGKEIEYDNKFLNKKTIYKLEDDKW